jgi:hypothetical protein
MKVAVRKKRFLLLHDAKAPRGAFRGRRYKHDAIYRTIEQKAKDAPKARCLAVRMTG